MMDKVDTLIFLIAMNPISHRKRPYYNLIINREIPMLRTKGSFENAIFNALLQNLVAPYNMNVRERAMKVIKEQKKENTPEVKKAYIDNLDNPDPWVRMEAVNYLLDRKDASFENTLEEKILNALIKNINVPFNMGISDRSLRKIQELKKENDPRVREGFIANIDSADTWLALDSINYLLNKGEKDSKVIDKIKISLSKLSNNQYYFRYKFIECLRILNDESFAIHLFTNNLSSEHADIRSEAACELLQRHYETEAVFNGLIKNLEPQNTNLCKYEAITILFNNGKISYSEDTPLLKKCFNIALEIIGDIDQSTHTRRWCLNFIDLIFRNQTYRFQSNDIKNITKMLMNISNLDIPDLSDVATKMLEKDYIKRHLSSNDKENLSLLGLFSNSKPTQRVEIVSTILGYLANHA